MVAAILNWFAEYVRAHESDRLELQLDADRAQQARPNPGLDISAWLNQRSE